VAVNTPGGTAEETVPLPSDVSTANLFTSNAACTPSGTCTAIGTLSTNPSQSLLLTITT
jgi:hypothetical protein